MANKPNGTLYIEAPKKMEPGMEDSVDSRKEPPVSYTHLTLPTSVAV